MLIYKFGRQGEQVGGHGEQAGRQGQQGGRQGQQAAVEVTHLSCSRYQGTLRRRLMTLPALSKSAKVSNSGATL